MPFIGYGTTILQEMGETETLNLLRKEMSLLYVFERNTNFFRVGCVLSNRTGNYINSNCNCPC